MNLWTIDKYTCTLCIDECRFIIDKIALPSFNEIIVTFSDCTFTFFSVSSVGDKMSSEGQEFSGCSNQSGPFQEILWFKKSDAANLFEAQSAGVSFVGTYFNYWLEQFLVFLLLGWQQMFSISSDDLVARQL